MLGAHLQWKGGGGGGVLDYYVRAFSIDSTQHTYTHTCMYTYIHAYIHTYLYCTSSYIGTGWTNQFSGVIVITGSKLLSTVSFSSIIGLQTNTDK